MPSSPEQRCSERSATALAWHRYLEQTRCTSDETYELVEALAWRELQRELTQLVRSRPPRAERRHLFHRLAR